MAAVFAIGFVLTLLGVFIFGIWSIFVGLTGTPFDLVLGVLAIAMVISWVALLRLDFLAWREREQKGSLQ